jgi:hypothetical protein
MEASLKSYTPAEVSVALVLALALQVAFFALLTLAGGVTSGKAVEPPPPAAMPIAVRPILDDLPLLKLGGKRVPGKLPDMWKKAAPVKRYEASSAPSPLAPKAPEELPTTPLAKSEAPPPDAEIAKEVDETLEAPEQEVPNLPTEGAADGVREGTETDPLKARAVSQYKMAILAWFNARFRPPLGELDCATLSALRTSVAATVGGRREITGFTLTRPSGNPVFDAKVESTMAGLVGQELPPPPPLYPDILETSVFPTFSGKHPQCAD